MLAILFSQAAAQGGFCQKSTNSAQFFNMSSTCNNAGSCLDNDQTVGTPFGVCECCQPYLSGNSCNGLNPTWVFGAYEGTTCNAFNRELHAVVSYILHLSNVAVDGDLEGVPNEIMCHRGSAEPFTGVDYDDANAASTPDVMPIVKALIHNAASYTSLVNVGYANYKGLLAKWRTYTLRDTSVTTNNDEQLQHCRICREGMDNCRVAEGNGFLEYPASDAHSGEDEHDHERHIMLSFATDFNTYYNFSCAKANNNMPQDKTQAAETPGCPQVIDFGGEAKNSWDLAIKADGDGAAHGQAFMSLAKSAAGSAVGTSDYPAVGLGWTSNVALEKLAIDNKRDGGTITGSLPLPTLSPTLSPTAANDCFAAGYTHQVEDLVFLGVSDTHCREGLEAFWPGGSSTNMCASPYVICLPEENCKGANCPNNPGFPLLDGGVDVYLSNSDPYTLDQCKKECAYDQRCTGFEFWSEDASGGQTGFCSLIDDIPVVGGTMSGSYTNEQAILLVSEWNTLPGRICYQKQAACNPYFQADDLNDVMLNCYCPNNRKGFYTKKVVRTAAATKFCAYDEQDGDAVTTRIKEAQANRMFHLCENWCLFNTQSPRTESWYHDPWVQCWREQYAGIGTHRSYCYRVIRDPMTIEQYMIDTRSANMCTAASGTGSAKTPTPTYEEDAPTGHAITWVAADAGDTCADACAAQGGECSEDSNEMTAEWCGSSTQQSALCAGRVTSAGHTCLSFDTATKGWAAPAFRISDGACLGRNEENDTANPPLETTCNMSIGANYKRICSCY